jgi:hypothetical protein
MKMEHNVTFLKEITLFEQLHELDIIDRTLMQNKLTEINHRDGKCQNYTYI